MADVATVSAGSAGTVAVLGNDLGTGLSISTVSSPLAAQGMVQIVGSSVVFTANPAYSGPVTLIYTVVDAEGRTATATLVLTVLPVATADSLAVAAG